MNTGNTRHNSFRSRLRTVWRIGNAVLADNLPISRHPVEDNRTHMQSAAEWLAEAQNATPDDGVSRGYSLKNGWGPSYPETTGYIIPTLLNYARFTGCPVWGDRAQRMADWLLTVQLGCGAFAHPFAPEVPIVFDTGQVLFGLLASFQHTQAMRYREAAIRAAEWLIAVQDASGAWSRHSYGGPSVYYTRVAWALIEAAQVLHDTRYVAAARKNLDWAIGQQHPNGWFQHNTFPNDQFPTLHTIAYTAQGLFESGERLGEPAYVQAAARTALGLLDLQMREGKLCGEYDSNWRSVSRPACLTGVAQTTIVWNRLSLRDSGVPYAAAVKQAIRFLKSTQNLRTPDRGRRGGIKGSHPIQGRYIPLAYPNWAAKFFLDALLLEESRSGADMNGLYPG